MLGDVARARALLDEGAERFLAAGDERGRADVLVRRAYLSLAEGSIPDARDCLEQALEYRRRTNDRRGIGLVLSGLGMIDTDAGAYDDAEQRLAEARGLFRRAGDRWGLVIALLRTSDLEVSRGRLDAAQAALQDVDVVLHQTGVARWNAHMKSALAEIAVLQGDPDRAARLFPRRATVTRRMPTRPGWPPSRRGFAALLSRRKGAANRARLPLPRHRRGKVAAMSQTLEPALGEATVQELREAVVGGSSAPGRTGMPRRARSGTACTKAGDPG